MHPNMHLLPLSYALLRSMNSGLDNVSNTDGHKAAGVAVGS